MENERLPECHYMHLQQIIEEEELGIPLNTGGNAKRTKGDIIRGIISARIARRRARTEGEASERKPPMGSELEREFRHRISPVGKGRGPLQ